MYRTVAQLDSVMGLLAAWFPQLCTRFLLPNASVQGRPIYALRMRAGGGTNRRGVLLAGGLHARELMNPDAIVDLQLDLVRCYLNETGLVLGGKTFSALDIKVMLETLDIWMLPCGNPDGREYVLNVDDMWRKNRRDNPGTACVGVDLNRNFDFVWGVTTSATSCNPCFDTFVGANAFSEPETLNVKYLCDTYRIDVFADIHSYSELILYPWGHAPTQTTDPSQRFTGLATGTCAPLSPSGHQEYMTPRDQLRFQTVSQRIVNSIKAVRNRIYTPETSFELYATTGTSSDYVYSRHIANPALRKTYGFAFETGPFVGNSADSFHPADPTLVKRDAKAGMLTLIQQSICAIEFIGAMALTADIQEFRAVRDELLATTETGRGWIALFERVQVPLLGAVLADKTLARDAMRLLERAGELLLDEDAIVTERDVKQGLVLLDAVARRPALAELRRDIAAVRAQLAKARDQSVRRIVEDLMGPRRRGRKPANGRRRRRERQGAERADDQPRARRKRPSGRRRR
jgi:murein tripeptide amidase MpaA